MRYRYLPAVLWLCEPSSGPMALDGQVRVPSTWLLLGLCETWILWLRGLTWGAARGLSRLESDHTSAVIPPQSLLCAPSACGTCPTDAPSATSLPGSLLRSLLLVVSHPSMTWGLLFTTIRFFFFFFNLQLSYMSLVYGCLPSTLSFGFVT